MPVIDFIIVESLNDFSETLNVITSIDAVVLDRRVCVSGCQSEWNYYSCVHKRTQFVCLILIHSHTG